MTGMAEMQEFIDFLNDWPGVPADRQAAILAGIRALAGEVDHGADMQRMAELLDEVRKDARGLQKETAA